MTARNKCQSLMLRLLQNWELLPTFRRQAALAAVFSLWRAVFLLVKEQQDQPFERVDEAAKGFLERVIRTNAISFADDLKMGRWSSTYYVQNAVFRIIQLTEYDFATYSNSSPVGTVRDAWNEAFEQLDKYIPGTISGTVPPETSAPDGSSGT